MYIRDISVYRRFVLRNDKIWIRMISLNEIHTEKRCVLGIVNDNLKIFHFDTFFW